MNTQRIEEMALFLTLVLISIGCVSATAVQDSQIEIISTKPTGDQPPSALNQEQNSTPDINSLFTELSVQLAENKVEIKKLQRQNEEQSTTLKELEVQKSELEKPQQQQYKQLQEQYKQLQQQQQQYKQQQEQQQQDTQHLQNQIQTQAAELVSIKSKANMTEEKVEALRKDREVRKVAFSVSLMDSGAGFKEAFNTHTNLIFKNIIENIGNAYNPQTGNFTAPVRGAYHFEFTIHGHGFAPHVSGARLIKNEEFICSAYERQSTGQHQSSNGATLLLEMGDVVFLRQWSYTVIYDDVEHHLNTFSGHLLFTM